MSSPRVEVLLWAKRIVAKKSAEAHQLLEIQAEATVDQAQEAFHKIARIAHPDLHRTTLGAEELELVTTAYAQVANAYQQFRTNRMQTSKIPQLKQPAAAPDPKAKRATTPGSSPTTPPVSAAPAVLVAETPTPSASHATGQMNSKALIYYRKAESALRQGDVRAGTLNLKMAIAADPQSTFLRTALTEIEAELKKP